MTSQKWSLIFMLVLVVSMTVWKGAQLWHRRSTFGKGASYLIEARDALRVVAADLKLGGEPDLKR